MNRLLNLAATVLLLGAGLGTARAHDHWVAMADTYPLAPTNMAIEICSGHYFPKSSFSLDDRVLERVTIVGPNGTTNAVRTVSESQRRMGAVELGTSGVYRISFTLRRPRAAAPSYEGKVIVVSRNGPDRVEHYRIGHGLEIVPLRPLSALTAEARLPLAIHMDGTPVAGSLTVARAGGKTSFLAAQPAQPAELYLRNTGRYLITTHVQGRGCSLYLNIGEATKDNE